MSLLVTSVVGITLLCWFGWKLYKAEKQKESTFADCDASEALTNWFEENPHRYIEDSPEGKAIVKRRIETYRVFLETHRFTDDKHHMDWLRSLLTRHNPKPPRRKKNSAVRSSLKRSH